jgi:hypothetical protein
MPLTEADVISILDGIKGDTAHRIRATSNTVEGRIKETARQLQQKFDEAFNGMTADQVIAEVKQGPDKVSPEVEAKANVEEDPGLGPEPKVEQHVGPANEEKAEPGGDIGEFTSMVELPSSRAATEATEETAEAAWEDRGDETPDNDDNSRSAAPKAMRQQDHWVLRAGKQPVSRSGIGIVRDNDTGEPHGWDEPGFWYPYDDVIEAFEHRRPPAKTYGVEINGIGFIIMREPELEGRQIIFTDIDGCRDPQTHEVSAWASEILKKMNSATEISSSGTGFHIMSVGKLPDDLDRIEWHGPDDLSPAAREHIIEKKPTLKDNLDKKQPAFNHIEIYEHNRHVALTFKWMSQFPSECELRTKEIAEIVATAPTDATSKKRGPKKAPQAKKARKKKELSPLAADAPGCIDTSDFTPEGEQLIGSHPVLGSASGRNLIVNHSEGTYCWMHNGINTGGDGWVWLSHMCGAVPWDQPGAGALRDREVLLQTMQYAVDQGVFAEDELFPERKQLKKDAEAAMKVKDEAFLDPGLPFRPENIRLFARVKQNDRALYESILAAWKRKVKTTDFNEEVDIEIKASKRRERKKVAAEEVDVKDTPIVAHLDDDELIRAAESSQEFGSKFKKLMAGLCDGFNYKSEPEARLGLLEIIAWYADSRFQVVRVFQKSKLWGRAVEKAEWPRLADEEVDKATNLANTRGHYKPPEEQRAAAWIRISNRRLHEMSDETLAALIAANSPPKIFVRGNVLTRVVRNDHNMPVLEIITPAMLDDRASRAADFVDVQVIRGEEYVTLKSPPPRITQNILSRGNWDFPKIQGVTPYPIIRSDGSISTTPGYDLRTEYFYDGNVEVELIEKPTQQDAKDSATYIMDEVFCDFPFAEEASRTHALVGLLSLLIRPILKGLTPLILINKPNAGTGASLYMDLISLISSGMPCPMSTPPTREEEYRKSITAHLLKGESMICYDNIEADFRSPSLSSAITTSRWSDRILGLSQSVEIIQHACWYATGNGVTLGGDLPRRTIGIDLDAAIPRPAERVGFRHPAIKNWVLDHRGELLGKALTIIRAWILAGRPTGSLAGRVGMGSFEEWVEMIDGILTFAGMEHFDENREKLYSYVNEESENLSKMLDAAYPYFTSDGTRNGRPEAFTTKEFVKVISTSIALRADAAVKIAAENKEIFPRKLLDQAPDDLRDAIEQNKSKSVGRMLQKMKDKRFEVEGEVKAGEKRMDYMVHQVRGSTTRQKVMYSKWKIVMVARGEKYKESPDA